MAKYFVGGFEGTLWQICKILRYEKPYFLNFPSNIIEIMNFQLKALVVKNSVLHDFGFGKVSRIHETFLMELQLFGWRHFSKTEVVQNTILNH